jgi:hypothetical protein
MESGTSTGSYRWVISPWYAATFVSARGPIGNLMVDSCSKSLHCTARLALLYARQTDQA